MVLHSGPNARLPAAFLALPSSCNSMAPSVAPLTIRSTHKNVAPNTMALCASCMPDASGFVAPVRSASSVKNTPPPKSRVGSVPCFGQSRLILLPLPLHPLCRSRHLCLRPHLCSGAIGLADLCAASGFSSSAGKPSPSPGSLSPRQSLLLNRARRCSRVNTAPTTDSPGRSAWLAMPVRLTLPDLLSSYMASPLASLRPSVPLLRPSRKRLFSHSAPTFPFSAGWEPLLYR